jgi:ABC-type nitrate/sulfonate/bicarbonate transport system substrate-binding protein
VPENKISRSAFLGLAGCAGVSLVDQVKAQERKKVTISYPNGGFNWPLFIAVNTGLFEQEELDVKLEFGAHPTGIAMLVSGDAQASHYPLEQALQAATVAVNLKLVGSWINRGGFALMAWRDIESPSELKGKRIAIGQIGDANQFYAVAVLTKSGLMTRDVEWIPTGPNLASRVAALASRRADAAILVAPTYFSLDTRNFRVLIDFMNRPDVYASAVLVVRDDRGAPMERLELLKKIVRAQTRAVHMFYSDRRASVDAFLRSTPMAVPRDVERMYDLYASANAFERVPFVLRASLEATVAQQTDSALAARMKAPSLLRVVDNRAVMALVEDGFFERVFGRAILSEQRERSLGAMR